MYLTTHHVHTKFAQLLRLTLLYFAPPYFATLYFTLLVLLYLTLPYFTSLYLVLFNIEMLKKMLLIENVKNKESSASCIDFRTKESF